MEQGKRTVIIDHTGERSLDVAAFFIGHGLNRTVALAGGIDNYSKEAIPLFQDTALKSNLIEMTYHVKNLIFVAFITFQIIESNSKGDSNWPSWRGVTGNGSAPDTSKPPREWSEEKYFVEIKNGRFGPLNSHCLGEQTVLHLSYSCWGKRIPPVPDNAPGSHDNLPVSQNITLSPFASIKDRGKYYGKQSAMNHFLTKVDTKVGA